MDGHTKQDIVTIEEPKTDVLMAVVSELARDGKIEAVKEIVKLRNDELARIARLSYMAAFVAMKPHLKRIENKHKNDQTKSKYAKLEDINAELDPVLEAYGFATSTPIASQDEKSVTVKAILMHKDGHSEETMLTMPWDKTGIAGSVNKTDPHALASSIKYARRVAVCAIVNISTGDGVDKDGNNNKDAGPITIEQAAEIDLRVRALGDDYHKRFMKWVGVPSIPEILDVNYKRIITAISTAEKEAKTARVSAQKM